MQDLFIDIGNSFIKAAIQNGGDWSVIFRGNTSDKARFFSWLDGRKGNRMIICSVFDEVTRIIEERYAEAGLKILANSDIPAKLIQYDTIGTLGMDRFLSSYAASVSGGGAAVVIDAGSACTVDYISAESVFMGGIIMPGHRSMIYSISNNFPAIPEPDGLIPAKWPGKSSLDSVKWGTTGAFIEAIKGFLSLYKRSFGDFNVFVTGGDAGLVAKYMGDEFLLRQTPFLVFDGMKWFETEYQQRP